MVIFHIFIKSIIININVVVTVIVIITNLMVMK